MWLWGHCLLITCSYIIGSGTQVLHTMPKCKANPSVSSCLPSNPHKEGYDNPCQTQSPYSHLGFEAIMRLLCEDERLHFVFCSRMIRRQSPHSRCLRSKMDVSRQHLPFPAFFEWAVILLCIIGSSDSMKPSFIMSGLLIIGLFFRTQGNNNHSSGAKSIG